MLDVSKGKRLGTGKEKHRNPAGLTLRSDALKSTDEVRQRTDFRGQGISCRMQAHTAALSDQGLHIRKHKFRG